MSDTPAPVIIPPRTVTQITAAGNEPNVLFALTSDGLMWHLNVRLGYGWARLPDVPGDDIPPPPLGTPLPSTMI